MLFLKHSEDKVYRPIQDVRLYVELTLWRGCRSILCCFYILYLIHATFVCDTVYSFVA